MNLTAKDRKTIKYEKRMGIVFLVMILSMGGFFNLITLLDTVEIDWLILVLSNIGILGLGFLVLYLMNRKLDQDLETGIKIIKTEKVQRKEDQTSYEAGSGSMYIPILGNLFPKLWGQEMKPNHKLNLIINNCRYEVEKDVYDKIKKGDIVEMHYSKYSETLLGIEKI